MIMMFTLFMIYLFKITASLRKPFIKTRTQLPALQSFHRLVAKDLILIKNLNETRLKRKTKVLLLIVFNHFLFFFELQLLPLYKTS